MPPKKATADPPKEYSEAEKRELLAHYVEVPKNEWNMLAPGDHIRYVRADGGFRQGGIIATVYGDTGSLQVASGIRGGGAWGLRFVDVSKIYLRVPLPVLRLQRDVERALKTMDANVQKLAARIKELQRK